MKKQLTAKVAETFVKLAIPPPMIKTFPEEKKNIFSYIHTM